MFVPVRRFVVIFLRVTLSAWFSGQGLENADCWYSESTSATSSVDSSEYNSDDGFVDIESEDVKISAFSVSTSKNIWCAFGMQKQY